MSDSDNVKEALSATKEEFSNEFSRISLLQDSNIQLQTQISELISTNEQKEISIKEKENLRYEFKEQLESEKQIFYFKIKNLNTQLDNAIAKAYEDFHQYDDQSLILAQKNDYCQQLINHLKSQEKENQHFEELYSYQMTQTESIVQSIADINNSSDIYQNVENLKTLEIPKIKAEINSTKRIIGQMDQVLNKLKSEKKQYNDKSQNLRIQLLNPNNNSFEKCHEEIESEMDNLIREKTKTTDLNNAIAILNQKINSLARKIKENNNIRKEIATSMNTQNEQVQFKAQRVKKLKNEVKGMKFNTQELSKKTELLNKKFEKYAKVQNQKNECVLELKENSEELSNAHKVIKKLKQIIPQLIEHSTQAEMKYHKICHELTIIEDELKPRPVDQETLNQQIAKSTKTLEKITQQIEEKMKENETYELIIGQNNSAINDDSIIDMPLPIESGYELKLKTDMNNVNKEIIRIKKKIKKANSKLSKLKYSKKVLNNIMITSRNQATALERIHDDYSTTSYAPGQSRKCNKLLADINNLQLKINAKKGVVSEMQSNLYKQSSLLIHTFHNCNPNDVASTRSMNQDIIAKSLLLKRHDPACCVEHECTVYKMKKENERSQCPFSKPYNYAVV